MEDAHIAAVQLGSSKTTAMFGVFDGHGGRCTACCTACIVLSV